MLLCYFFSYFDLLAAGVVAITHSTILIAMKIYFLADWNWILKNLKPNPLNNL